MPRQAFQSHLSKPLGRLWRRWVKPILPRGLFGRALLIIMLPIALMQIIVAYIFFEAHWQTVTKNLANAVAADIAVTTILYEQSPNPQTVDRLDEMMRSNLQLSVQFHPSDRLPLARRKAFFSSLDNTLRNALTRHTNGDFWFDTTRYPHHIDIRLRVDQGVLTFIVPRERVFAPTGYVFLFWLLAITLLLSLISILFILNQVRPIAKLAQATENFGKGRPIGDFKPYGATEVRQASRSFLNMRGRILRHIQRRTDFLAGVSHDLRTPLTRLKLHLSLEDETEDVLAAKEDVKAMEIMLDSYLEFARDDVDEKMILTNMDDMIQRILKTNQAPNPEAIKVTTHGELDINVRPICLRRAITNIIENAQSHADYVDINIDGGREHVILWIDDNGNGIAAEDRALALKPFTRLDTARNQNRKGVGLGLSLANDIVQSHGGTLALRDSPRGGLRVAITLPR